MKHFLANNLRNDFVDHGTCLFGGSDAGEGRSSKRSSTTDSIANRPTPYSI